MPDLNRLQAMGRTARQGIGKAHCTIELPVRHHFLDPAHNEIDQQGLWKPQHLAKAGHHDVLDRDASTHLIEGMGEVLDNDHHLGTGITQLVLELARSVERIDVDHRVAGTQRTEQGHVILEQVRHHERNPRTHGQLQLALQIARELRRQTVEFSIGHALAHADISGARGKSAHPALEQITDRAEFIHVDFGRHASGIALQPDLVHVISSLGWKNVYRLSLEQRPITRLLAVSCSAPLQRPSSSCAGQLRM